jgi:hypothetical protein
MDANPHKLAQAKIELDVSTYGMRPPLRRTAWHHQDANPPNRRQRLCNSAPDTASQLATFLDRMHEANARANPRYTILLSRA